MMKSVIGAVAALTAVALASPASAAVSLSGSVPSQNISGTASCTGTGDSCIFTDTLSFITPTGYNRASFSLISSAASTATDLTFTSVVLNDGTRTIPFTITNGMVDVASLVTLLTAGATNTLSITGTLPIATGATASESVAYGGTLSFSNVAAVPEPATWAMMLVGFAMVGSTARYRRRKSNVTYA